MIKPYREGMAKTCIVSPGHQLMIARNDLGRSPGREREVWVKSPHSGPASLSELVVYLSHQFQCLPCLQAMVSPKTSFKPGTFQGFWVS